MNNYKECKNAFFSGEKNLKKGNILPAKYWYMISKQHPSFISESIDRLYHIEILLRRLDKARELLNTNYYADNSLNVEKLFGDLECMEYNFSKAIEYYEYCLKNKYNSFTMFKEIARCYYELGEHDNARKYLEKVKSTDKSTANLYEAYILYYERKYEKALELLKSIEKSKLDNNDFKTYDELIVLLKYKFRNIESISNIERYSYARLFDQDDKLLIEHIKKHFDTNETDIGCFKKELDIMELIELSKQIVENTNANHYGSKDYYRYSFDFIIGTKNNEPTKDIEIITHLDSKNIITMYPIKVSDEFDIEKISTSKQLKLKRENTQK